MEQPTRPVPEPVADAGSGRALRGPVVVLAAAVVIAIGIALVGGFFGLVAFSALAAVVCRRVQLALLARGLPGWAALTVTVSAFVVVLALLGVAGVASAVVLAERLEHNAERLGELLRDAGDTLGGATGVPPDLVPPADPATIVQLARDLVSALAPIVTGLAMSVLIVAYLLLDASRLRARMLDATSAEVMSRYDALASELVTYFRVRTVLGAAAAVGDTLLLLVVGVPFPVLWGIVSFLFSFVPNIGFVVALVPPTALALLESGPGAAVLVVLGYVAINLAFDYVLQPRVMAVSLDLSPMVVVVTILAWTFLIGPAGALLAVPLTIALRALLRPFPGARWFVALLGPVTEDPGAPGGRPEEIVAPAARAGPPPAPIDPTIRP